MFISFQYSIDEIPRSVVSFQLRAQMAQAKTNAIFTRQAALQNYFKTPFGI